MAHGAQRVTACKGVVPSDVTFDNWWHGGARSRAGAAQHDRHPHRDRLGAARITGVAIVG